MVTAQETTLQRLLEGAKQYQVPLYQRTYSWTELQFARIWDDVCQLARDRADHPGATHFIGSLVLAPSPAIGPVGVAEYLVVDGQQRLTTLSILLCAIRDHRAEHEDPKHRLRLDQQYLTNPFEEQRWLKLVPTQADRNAYTACVKSTPHVGGDDAVGRAYRFFAKALDALGTAEEPVAIEQIESAVITGLALVAITAKPGDNVYRIFESLNNTGLTLTQADLLRNYIFMRLPHRGPAVYESLWLPLQERFTPTELVLLFWLDLVHRDPKVKQTETYSSQQERLEKLRTEADVEAEVQRFSRLGALLRVILHPTEEQDPGVRQRLERLSAWGTTTVYPVLLHLLDRRDRGTATSEQIATAMLYLESFFVRRLLIGRSTMNINRILLSIVTEMSKSLPVDEAVRAYLSTGRKYFATDAAVRSAVRSIPFYLHGRAPQRSLVLRWLEESYGSKEPVSLEKATIEHVLPQTLPDEWRRMLATDCGPDENLDEMYEALVHTLGNLTLTGYNQELGNKPFAEKRERLKESGIRLSQEIVAQSRWGRPEIHARAEALAERVISSWPGPTAQAGNQSEVPWDLMDKALSELPAGSWTTYGDLAALVGTAPMPLGMRLANHPAPNAHRVLQAEGTIAPGFRWLEPDRTDDPREVLRAEGVTFDRNGRADQGQRIGTEELAQLAGITSEELPERALRYRPGRNGTYAERFLEQITARRTPAVSTATVVLLEAWTAMGGTLSYGTGAETSCFLMARRREHELGSIWPAVIYPSGKFEVVFQHLSVRTPFNDIALREDFRQRLNQLPGVNIAAARLALRPGFPLEVLADAEAREALLDHLRWFLDQAQPSTSEESVVE
ncbi:GmrSD restriction endonuclease domain-containing protein [Micromonospora sp. WMMD708]|uniref:GmrSD restriction endonuclease domain-containing protein n=1 Tax=Micromonospora sp. WMMD708 TaxID=3403464 RepID=UPI003BF49842